MQIAHAARVEDGQGAARSPGKPNDQSAALVMVATRLLAIADNPATQWSDAGRLSARKAAREMLAQAGGVPHSLKVEAV